MMKPKYGNIEVEFTGKDGNAFNLMAIVSKAMRKEGIEKSEIDQFMEEATAGDYDHLIQTCMKWVKVK